MLRKMGFCPKWINWVDGCLQTASMSILINGSPTVEFNPQKGLKQGDPLAPLLFNIVAEGLMGIMREALKVNKYKGLLVGRNEVEISILQYADDTIFFGEASMQNVKVLKAMLRSFEMVSSLKINFAKSQFGAVEKSVQWLNEAALYLNCSLLSVPFIYLGIPIGANPKSSVTWEPIVKKCE